MKINKKFAKAFASFVVANTLLVSTQAETHEMMSYKKITAASETKKEQNQFHKNPSVGEFFVAFALIVTARTIAGIYFPKIVNDVPYILFLFDTFFGLLRNVH
jgi:hypothetical protein